MNDDDHKLLEVVAVAVDSIHGPPESLSAHQRQELDHSRPAGTRYGRASRRSTHAEASAFSEWVDWLLETYPVRAKIPVEWVTYPAIVGELWALSLQHVAATSADADPRELNDWHEALDRALGRIDEWASQTRKARQLRATATK